MELHPFYQAMVDAYREAGRPSFHQLAPEDARAQMRDTIAAAPKAQDLPDLAKVEDMTVEGPNGPIAIRLYEPKGEVLGTCVYLHAGGWVIGDIDLSDNTCRRLSGRAGCRIVSVDYRKAPEHPYPQPLDDAWSVLTWAAGEFAGSLAIAGESAGGNLAAACAIRARNSGGPALAGQLLAYPATDHDLGTGSYRQVGDKGWLLSTADMRWFWDHYCPEGVDREQPEISPLRVESAAGLPPMFIALAELDPLRDEGIAFASRLASEGVQVSMRCDPGMAHGYLSAAGVLAPAAEALDDAVRWLRNRLGS